MNYLASIDNFKEYIELYKAIDDSSINSIYLYGMVNESTGHFLYSLYENTKRPVFVILENAKKAQDVYEAASSMLGDKLELFPELDVNFQDFVDLDLTRRSQRLRVLTSLLEGEKKVVVTTIEALNRKLMTKKDFEDYLIEVNLESEIDTTSLAEKLSYMGYERVNSVQSKGQFAIKGAIIDIFQLVDDYPTRIELFDVEVDSIRKFDILDQRSIGQIDRLLIGPAKELILDGETKLEIAGKIQANLDKMLKFSKNDQDRDRISDKFLPIVEALENSMDIANVDLLYPFIEESSCAYFMDYMPEDSILVYDDLSRLYEENMDRESIYRQALSYELENYSMFSAHEKTYLGFDQILKRLEGFKSINVTALMKRMRLLSPDALVEIKTIETEKYNYKWDDFIDGLSRYRDEGYKIIIGADGLDKAKNLQSKLLESDLVAAIPESLDYRLEEREIIILSEGLKQGFIYPSSKVIFISHNEIYGNEKVKSKKQKKLLNKRDLINYTDLEPGDYVVHENYGVGQYVGIKNLEIQSSRKDFLEIFYKNGDKLFIPTSEMDLISKYIGTEEKSPKLSKLNSVDWTKTKQRAQKSIDEIAQNIVELYATRSKIKGFSFSPDSPWQREFEDSFIYEETMSQLKSIDEIKRDMESDRPMDRLLCGDVGYGKTEVALRAAFKAILDGKQVAMLAPTTILVKQHYNTMVERFKNFPVTIDYLSRFKTPAKAKLVKENLKKGYIDFIVGTHSLLSQDVRFKDLGLLIVDEEQRFGVKDKEKIKELKANVDVLTLSATPIPRTLQMSLSGIREMSLLNEAPESRLPTNTYVIEYNPSIIRDAILRELRRDGQIYFVYNRVYGINIIKEHLEKLVPEARVVVAHGKMSTRQLENTLDSFVNKEYDILLSTSIIETGMNIQNVNTMIIYNADQMGLSQLYQLKGRIGRSNRTSYAYFTYEENKVITEIAEKRLKAIKDFSELGSGYKIAMRDLELRGAGNLLGESQHGHIESIGYDLYVRMLEKTINKLKGIEVKKDIEVKVDIDINAFIPDNYIKDQNEKINIYKKISLIESDQEYHQVIEELIDRFGDLPKSVENIISLSLIKALMAKNNFYEMVELEETIEFRYNDLVDFNINNLEELSKSYRGHMKFDFTNEPKIIIGAGDNKVDEALNIFRIIDRIKTEEINEKR